MNMNLQGKEPAYKGRYDVIVAGGGIAGVAAAVSASRNGAKTLLIEKGVNLGGLATMGLISLYEPLCDGKGNQMIYGIAEELIKLSVRYGFDNLHPKWGGSGHNKPKNDRYNTRFSPGVFSIALDDYVLKNGVKILFDTLVTYPVMEGGKCIGVVVENVNGREYYEAGAVVDATGNASVMHRCRSPLTIRNGSMN
ncbi:MAG: FAD-dependent oxidoreductase [Lachnospiraceae bacterium]|nr:FAD-dependent oxidoreductase [Lachnospiraceae bacterium]